MNDSRFAAIADIHGNVWALEAVLADIDRRGVPAIVDLGDDLYGPLDVNATWEMLRSLKLPRIRGNCDRILFEDADVDPVSTLGRNRKQLSEAQIEWLLEAPPTIQFGNGVLLCHGTPVRDDEYLLWTFDGMGMRSRTDEELDSSGLIKDTQLLLCGHTHQPETRVLTNGRMVVNVGSIGVQAFTDPVPQPHALEAGTPHASYAIFDKTKTGWQVEHVFVNYDWEKAARCAERNHRSDWAGWLRTGCA